MRINSFIPALHARALAQTSKAISRSLERLSSGSRLNSPSDDVASWTQTVRLDSQVRGLRQANQNINLAQGLLQTAEAAISSQIDIVTRMRDLAIQASSGTLSSDNRVQLNAEIRQLLDEFQNIVRNTRFNDINLLDGTFKDKAVMTGNDASDRVMLTIADLTAAHTFTQTVGTGSFDTRKTYSMSSFTDFQMVDLNGDGHLDVASTNTAGVMAVNFGKGDGTFQLLKTYASDASSGSNLQVGDVNNDGTTDIVVFNGLNLSASVYLNHGDGTFGPQTTFALTGFSMSGQLVDINSDGILDIGYIDIDNLLMSVQLGNGDGTFRDATSTPTSYFDISLVAGLQFADFTNDGKLDMITDDWLLGNIYFYAGNGDGTFGAVSTIASGTPGRILTEDFNKDGKLDIAVSQQTSTINTYFGDGAGGFTLNQALSITASNVNAVTGDVNNDGNLDILGMSGGTAFVYLGLGGGNFSGATTFSITTSTPTIRLADVNEDGVLDLIGRQVNNLAVMTGKKTTKAALGNVDLSTQAKAESLLLILDNALQSLTTENARLGSLHSRLDAAASTNLILSDTLAEAKARVADADIALEIAELTRNQILMQAQVAAATQANVNLQIVLNLLPR